MKVGMMQNIRNQFPNPRKCVDQNYEKYVDCMENGYCVGGAFFLYLNPLSDCKFPLPAVLGRKLREKNSYLSHEYSMDISNRITGANDEDQFEEAWNLLDEALSYVE